jgi:hypothetical protein
MALERKKARASGEIRVDRARMSRKTSACLAAVVSLKQGHGFAGSIVSL